MIGLKKIIVVYDATVAHLL